MAPTKNIIEMRTISYSCRYLFAGEWHIATASIDMNCTTSEYIFITFI